VRTLIGGDYGFPFNPNGRNARDIQHFVDYFGYTPVEALAAATGGELMGLDVGLIRKAIWPTCCWSMAIRHRTFRSCRPRTISRP
jgi:hypothetical protein